MSAAGDALQMLPARVARLRICTEPTTVAASASAVNRRRTRSSAATSVMTAVAGMTSRPSSSRIAGSSSAIRLTSTTTDGRADPSRSRITRSVPPARTRASGPCAARRATASASVPGRA